MAIKKEIQLKIINGLRQFKTPVTNIELSAAVGINSRTLQSNIGSMMQECTIDGWKISSKQQGLTCLYRAIRDPNRVMCYLSSERVPMTCRFKLDEL